MSIYIYIYIYIRSTKRRVGEPPAGSSAPARVLLSTGSGIDGDAECALEVSLSASFFLSISLFAVVVDVVLVFAFDVEIFSVSSLISFYMYILFSDSMLFSCSMSNSFSISF